MGSDFFSSLAQGWEAGSPSERVFICLILFLLNRCFPGWGRFGPATCAEASALLEKRGNPLCVTVLRAPRACPPQNHPECTCPPSPLPEHLYLTRGWVTLLHGRRHRRTDPQGLLLSERVTEVPEHGRAQALATVCPPDKHGVQDRQQVAYSCAIATQATCRGEPETCMVLRACTGLPGPRATLAWPGPCGHLEAALASQTK